VPTVAGTPTPPPAPAGPTINIGEEYGTAKKNLPPAKIVVIAVGAVLVVVLIASFLKRAQPQAAGSLDNVVAVEIPDQVQTMAALTFTIRNTSDKILYVRTLQGKIKSDAGESSADAVSAVDFERYFQAFPDLRSGAQPGEVTSRTIIVVFPVSKNAFNLRQSTSVVIQPYDQQLPIILTR
jgi:hypothetical protein